MLFRLAVAMPPARYCALSKTEKNPTYQHFLTMSRTLTNDTWASTRPALLDFRVLSRFHPPLDGRPSHSSRTDRYERMTCRTPVQRDMLQSAVRRFVAWLDRYGETSFDHQSYFAGPIGGRAKQLYYRK